VFSGGGAKVLILDGVCAWIGAQLAQEAWQVFETNSKMRDHSGVNNKMVLTFKAVSTEPAPFFDTPLWNVSLTLSQGELLLIRMERGRLRLPLADLAAGLFHPGQGAVEFLGRDWRDLTPDYAAKQRGKIGRIFEDQGWISNLDMDENITLAQRHHSTRSDADIEGEATQLARLFGLPGLPHRAVSGTRQEDLRRSALVRAFLGNPALVILERPTRNLFPSIMPPLINAIRTARDSGSAVIWTTSEDRVWNDKGIRATVKCTMFGSRMNVVEGGR
jgi:phospholipid/cholesterol/gamma-HCH transport system ATP-binding protein